MSECKCSCAYISVIVGIIIGVILGVLTAMGMVSTVTIFWVYLAIGVGGIFLTPIYALLNALSSANRCFCGYRRNLLLASIGTIIAAAVGLILAPTASITVLSIVVGISTFFTVSLLGLIVCLALCISCYEC